VKLVDGRPSNQLITLGLMLVIELLPRVDAGRIPRFCQCQFVHWTSVRRYISEWSVIGHWSLAGTARTRSSASKSRCL